MDFKKRREEILNRMEDNSILILYSGIESHVSADEYAPFEANRNFFYLTGLRRDNMILVLDKAAAKPVERLYIEEADPTMERWYGKKVTVEEAKEVTQIERVGFLDEFEPAMDMILTREDVTTVYFDTYRHQYQDLPDYNVVKANEFAAKYPGMKIRNCFPMIAEMRMQKDEDEAALIKDAIALTDEGLKNVMRNLTPGMKEYQAQADFEYSIKRNGADGVSFPTIAGSGMNGTMLHYETNQETCEDGTLLLLDLGAKYKGYCADITRTYPVNGTYSKRQREVYDIVLAANREVAKSAKPGMTTLDLNNICKKVLAEGCIKLGLIEKEEEIGKYYMHGVSHHLGIDVHDVTVDSNKKLRPGAIISDEPGLYIDEWAIGIRIEDDLMITEDGCVVLSEAIMRDADEIEAFMKEHRK
ncbi:aminopeptidase P N-terminal domain-containing protein [Roseburia sp. 831b]|uniref:aminopeptidase P N-terminal domain-containing protein n=1 Tax=Roseburia sp. 831b TaxID=1261635 RepID=UPI0009517312|nr:aminopeptidase P N-terminal domain-containing protein [Roseburia sp. 831b]MDY5882733.1 aminopeptidase P N-terminal domain-containing protein [Roseburia sp.]WVK72362.1 aminopeptidase P N-terminal domain-containing protein [Roseburia sp. 831b]